MLNELNVKEQVDYPARENALIRISTLRYSRTNKEVYKKFNEPRRRFMSNRVVGTVFSQNDSNFQSKSHFN